MFKKHLLIFNNGDLKVPWFGQIVVFEDDYDDIELQNIVMMSSPLRHWKTSPK